MILAVTFDVWETMIHDDPAVADRRSKLRLRRMAEVLREGGIKLDRGVLRQGYHDSWGAYERIWDAGHEVDTLEQMAMVLEPLAIRAADLPAGLLADLRAAYVDPVFTLPPVLNEGLVDVLVALKAKQLKLGLICNTGRTPGAAMRRFFADRGVLPYFDAVAFSNEEGIRKPDPEIFRRVLSKLDVAPEVSVHVGDNIIADITGAKSSGMLAVQIRTAYSEKAESSRTPALEPDRRISRLPELLAAIEELEALSRE